MKYQEILTNIRKILRSINLESKRIQKAHDISIPQLLCLNFLNSAPQFQSTVKEISENLTLNPSTVSGIVKRLDQKGFLAKLPNPSDRRGSIIALTQKGASLVQNSPILMHDRLDHNLAKLPQEQLEMVRKGLELLVELMGVEEIDAAPILVGGESLNLDNHPAS